MKSLKVSTLIFILLALFKMASAKDFKLKGGVYVFPHIEEFAGNTYHFSLGTGYQIGLGYKLSNHFTLQADFSHTRHKYKVKYIQSTAPTG